MKYAILTICFLASVTLYAQGPAGLITHWDMDGGVTDVSGHGHNGHPNFITPAPDRFGYPNRAYYFNGSTSVVTAPYLPDLNLTNYSICAIVKVMGFYSGTCQGNFIVTRGANTSPGNFDLEFNDNPNDGENCAAFDSTKDVFQANAGGTGASAPIEWSYTPAIVENQWYRVVATWDGIQYKIYVNGVLKNTVVNSLGGSLGTSSDSMSIGKTIFDGPSYPWPFKGVIDDIRIYDRILTDSETVHYGDTCGVVTLQPAAVVTAIGGTAVYTVHSSVIAAAYQWQQDIGLGFTNLSTSGPYSGVTTNTLTITGVTAALNAAHYRCLISNTWVCADTSSSVLLNISSLNVNTVITGDMITVYPNPSHDQVQVQLPCNSASTEIQVINEIGQVISAQTFTGSSHIADIGKLAAGVYMLRISGADFVVYKKIIKD